MSENPYESPENTDALANGRWRPPLLLRLLLYAGVIGLVLVLLLPAQRSAREPARRNQCQNQLRQIAVALNNYADTHGALPPAYTVDADGNRLHSWRTLLLPHLDQEALYESIDLTKPWDDPANTAARETIVDAFLCPSSPGEEHETHYLAITGPATAFPADGEVGLSELSDGAAETILVIDVPDNDRGVHWMSPNDIDADDLVALLGQEVRTRHVNVMLAAFADGHAQALPLDIDPPKLRAMLTIAGGETIEDD